MYHQLKAFPSFKDECWWWRQLFCFFVFWKPKTQQIRCTRWERGEQFDLWHFVCTREYAIDGKFGFFLKFQMHKTSLGGVHTASDSNLYKICTTSQSLLRWQRLFYSKTFRVWLLFCKECSFQAAWKLSWIWIWILWILCHINLDRVHNVTSSSWLLHVHF